MKTREQARKASGLRQFINNSGTSFSLLIALLIACVVYTIVSPKHVFFTARNFSNILVNSSITSIMAAGCTVAMLLGGMELLALGTWMYMKSALGSGPRDALMVVLARKTGRSVGFCRATAELIAIFVGWRLGGQVGIGTIVTGVGVGTLFNLNFALLHFRAADLHQENLPETLRRIRQRNAPEESAGQPEAPGQPGEPE